MSEPTRAGADPPRGSRKIPPLAWIILALLLVAAVWGFSQYGGTHVTPRGGETPMAAEGPSVMPAAPPSGDAPATPAGVVNGPAQPAAQ